MRNKIICIEAQHYRDEEEVLKKDPIILDMVKSLPDDVDLDDYNLELRANKVYEKRGGTNVSSLGGVMRAIRAIFVQNKRYVSFTPKEESWLEWALDAMVDHQKQLVEDGDSEAATPLPALKEHKLINLSAIWLNDLYYRVYKQGSDLLDSEPRDKTWMEKSKNWESTINKLRLYADQERIELEY
jgi:hypothetical protein